MNPQTAELSRCIDRLAELTQVFHDLLQRELAALSSWPIEGLNDLAREKNELARQISEVEAARVACLRSAGLADTGLGGMQQVLGTSLAGQQVLKRWDAVLEQIKRCHDANLAVGASIQAQARQTVRSLELLGSNRGITVTYGRDGMSRTGRASHRIGEA